MPAIDFEARRAWLVEHLTALQTRGVETTCAVDAASGALAGFMTLDRATGHIDQLAVATGHWGKGAAAALLDDAKRRATTLTLEVNQGNPRAMRFYEKNAFRRAGPGVNPTSGLKTWRYEWSN